MGGMRFEMNGDGQHRIVDPKGGHGPWSPYTSLSLYADKEGQFYVAGTAYGLLPKEETVYKLTEVTGP